MELVVWKDGQSNDIVIVDKDEAIKSIAKEMQVNVEVAESILLLINKESICLVTSSGFWRFLTNYRCLTLDDDTQEHLFREHIRHTVQYVEPLNLMAIKPYYSEQETE